MVQHDEPSFNVSSASDNSSHVVNESHHKQFSEAETLQMQIEDILHSKVVIAIALFGLIGNILNVLVLTQKGLQTSMGRMEKFAHTGLISLAVSDMMFCLVTLPLAFVSIHNMHFTSYNFAMMYNMYSLAVINIFILSSSMLTVTMAAGRYCAIVYPLRARQFFGMTCARRMIALVYMFCIGFNLPRFWRYKILNVECASGDVYYVRTDGPFKDYEMAYLCCYFLLGIMMPLLVLTYCNLFLLKALHQSQTRIIRFRRNEPQQETSQRITLTLVIIVVFFLVLAIPAELITLLRQITDKFNVAITNHQLNLAVAIVNVLQTINFSFNFVLYCIINTHFRHIVYNAMKCHWSAVFDSRRNGCDSEGGAESGMGTSLRSTRQTSLRTVVYSARLQNNIGCNSPDDCNKNSITHL